MNEVAEEIHHRISSIDLETDGETNYAEKYDFDWLKAVIRESLQIMSHLFLIWMHVWKKMGMVVDFRLN